MQCNWNHSRLVQPPYLSSWAKRWDILGEGRVEFAYSLLFNLLCFDWIPFSPSHQQLYPHLALLTIQAVSNVFFQNQSYYQLKGTDFISQPALITVLTTKYIINMYFVRVVTALTADSSQHRVGMPSSALPFCSPIKRRESSSTAKREPAAGFPASAPPRGEERELQRRAASAAVKLHHCRCKQKIRSFPRLLWAPASRRNSHMSRLGNSAASLESLYESLPQAFSMTPVYRAAKIEAG